MFVKAAGYYDDISVFVIPEVRLVWSLVGFYLECSDFCEPVESLLLSGFAIVDIRELDLSLLSNYYFA
jgi:hypothetical protein